MLISKKITTIACLLSVVMFAAMTSMGPDHDHPGFKNLKVLPKSIPHDTLHKVMDEWAHALGVKCNFCHVRGAADNKLDFASDSKPEKRMARKMFLMAAKINKKYFKGKKSPLGMVVGDIKCVTCHHGNPHPQDVKMGGMDMHYHDMHMPPPGSKRDSVPLPGNKGDIVPHPAPSFDGK